MNRELVDQLVQALMYEGYLLYPYRPCVKNRQRWTFGGLYPQSYAGAHGEAAEAQAECLVHGSRRARFDVQVRFLHLEQSVPGPDAGSWQESVERTVRVPGSEIERLLARARRHTFAYGASCTVAAPPTDAGEVLVRHQQALVGSVALRALVVEPDLFRITVQVRNDTPLEDPLVDRAGALLSSLVSTHLVLGVEGAEFVSLLEPPERWRAAAAACRNHGVWPVLVGKAPEHDTMLASPIILYDYPQIAPESAGDLFDATEIDEILTLRIMTLTDEEKQAIGALDERGRALLQRTEALAAGQMRKLHGTIRTLQPCVGEAP
jgi:hydrogenase maturation protease